MKGKRVFMVRGVDMDLDPTMLFEIRSLSMQHRRYLKWEEIQEEVLDRLYCVLNGKASRADIDWLNRCFFGE